MLSVPPAEQMLKQRRSRVAGSTCPKYDEVTIVFRAVWA
jgi:hypothetical protein